jgi:esterase/lipase
MIVYRARFKKEIISEFVVPERKTNKVLIICGGMPGYPAKQKYEKFFEFFTKKGFYVFVPRYRGSFESGGKFLEQSPEVDIKDIVDELPKGFRNIWDKKEFNIKNPQVYLVGSSFGGPAMLLNSKDKRVKKVIAFSPVIDWTKQNETVETFEQMESFVSEAFGEGYRIVKDGWKKLEKGDLYNPIREALKIDGKKCLIIHARDDDVVSCKPLKEFAQKTNTKVMLVKKGGHLGTALFERRFKKVCLDFFGITL